MSAYLGIGCVSNLLVWRYRVFGTPNISDVSPCLLSCCHQHGPANTPSNNCLLHAIRYVAKLLGVMQKGSLCVAAATSIALHTLTDVSCCKYCWYQQNCYHHPKSSNHKIHKGTAHVFPADAKIHLRTKPRGNPVLHQLSMSATW